MRPTGKMAIAVVLAAVLPNLSTLGNGFVYDDEFVLLENTVVSEPGRILDTFRSSYWGSLEGKATTSGYRPMTILSYHLNHRIAGADPMPYHAVNIALNGAACLLFFLAVLSFSGNHRASWLAATIFALHSVHTEAVASIVGRAELLAAIGVFGALLVHSETVRRASGRSWVGILGAAGVAALMLFGLLSKESAISGPLLAACLEAARGDTRPAGREARITLVPIAIAHVVAVGTFLALRMSLMGTLSPATGVHFMDNPFTALGWAARIPAALLTGGKAAVLVILPAQLASDYGFDVLPVSHPWASTYTYLGMAALAGLACAAWRTRRGTPMVAAGLAMALLAYLPVSNLVVVMQTVFGERTLFMASSGVCLAAGAAADRVLATGRDRVRLAAIVILSMACVFLAARTFTRNRDWRSDFTLGEADVQVNPRSVRLLNNYGNELMGRGRLKEACAHLERAVSIYDEVTSINANLGLCLLKSGKVEDSIRIFEQVLSEDPDDPVAGKHLPIAREFLAEMRKQDTKGGSPR